MDDAFADALVTEGAFVEGTGHHYFDGKSYFADTAFMNSMRGIMSGMEMKHMGFGEFTWAGTEGEVEFDRMRGRDFPGQSGRSHKLYDNKKGKLVAALIKLMSAKGKSELVTEDEDLAEDLKLGKKDKAVLAAFADGKAAEGPKLSTDGKRLDGSWMGGNGLAAWKGGKVHVADSGVRSGDVVKRALKKVVPKNDLVEGTIDEAAKAGQFFVIVDTNTGKAASKIFRGTPKADRARGKMKGDNYQVIDAMWHNPSRAKLKHGGMAEDGVDGGLASALGSALQVA